MLNTDLPEGTWQRLRFDAVVHDCRVTAPPLAAFAGLVQPTPEQVAMLMQRSDERIAADGAKDWLSAFKATLREFYAAVDGEAIVEQHAPEALVTTSAGEHQPARGVGRPRKTFAPELEPAPHVHGTPARWNGLLPPPVIVDADEASKRLRADFDAFNETVHHQAFDALDVGDNVIRTLNVAETAAVLGVSVQTLRNWRTLGYGPAYLEPGKIGHRYPVFRIVEWLETSAHAAHADDEGGAS